MKLSKKTQREVARSPLPPTDNPPADAYVEELLCIFERIRDPEIRELALALTREVADAAEKLGYTKAQPN
jgi:hypothetical protein